MELKKFNCAECGILGVNCCHCSVCNAEFCPGCIKEHTNPQECENCFKLACNSIQKGSDEVTQYQLQWPTHTNYEVLCFGCFAMMNTRYAHDRLSKIEK